MHIDHSSWVVKALCTNFDCSFIHKPQVLSRQPQGCCWSHWVSPHCSSSPLKSSSLSSWSCPPPFLCPSMSRRSAASVWQWNSCCQVCVSCVQYVVFAVCKHLFTRSNPALCLWSASCVLLRSSEDRIFVGQWITELNSFISSAVKREITWFTINSHQQIWFVLINNIVLVKASDFGWLAKSSKHLLLDVVITLFCGPNAFEWNKCLFKYWCLSRS